MATTSIGNGLAKISLDGVTVGYLINVTYTVDHEPREITNKDSSGGKRQYKEGLVNETATGEAYFDESHAMNFWDFRSYAVNRTVVSAEVGSTVTGDKFAEGQAYLTNASLTSPNTGENDSSSFSLLFTGGTAEDTQT